ncbi:hypothetical protein, partial [Laceyella putida]
LAFVVMNILTGNHDGFTRHALVEISDEKIAPILSTKSTLGKQISSLGCPCLVRCWGFFV